MSSSDLGQDGLRGVRADTRDLVEPLDACQGAFGPGGGSTRIGFAAPVPVGIGSRIAARTRAGAGPIVPVWGHRWPAASSGSAAIKCLDAR